MPSITTLVEDIETVLKTQVPHTPLSHEQWAESAWSMVKAAAPRPPTPGFVREEHVLYPTELGEECLRKLWYKLRAGPGVTSAPDALKFTYGHLLEEVLLTYAALAGHTVEDRQTKLVQTVTSAAGVEWQIRGRTDATIDGVVVDVKTCSSTMFNKLETYYKQVQWYGSVGPWHEAGILAMNKVNGRLKYEPVPFVKSVFYGPHPTALDELDSPEPPPRAYEPKPSVFGEEMPGECLFCPFKFDCWPGLRAFQYSFGPMFYVQLDKMPRTRELTREEVENAPLRG